MKEIPILFSGAMVRAILEGRKTQTRRVVKPRSYIADVVNGIPYEMTEDDLQPIKCPYGEKGNLLWVRETWKKVNNDFIFKTNILPSEMLEACRVYPEKEKNNWKPSIFMPRGACRIKLSVINVWAENLQDISDEDCIAEGIETDKEGVSYKLYGDHNISDILGRKAEYGTAYESYKTLWQSINGKKSWELL